jgi:uncharacterized protein (TIRG00374 family)
MHKDGTLDTFWQNLTSANPWWFAACVGCMGVTCLMGVVRWQLLLGVQGLHLGWIRTGQIFFVGAFFNSFMLGATGGDVIKAAYVANETHTRKAEAVMTVFLDRLIGMIGLLAAAFIVMVANLGFILRTPEMRDYLYVIGIMLAVILVALAVAIVPGAGKKIPQFERLLARFKMLGQVEKMVRAYRVYTGHKRVVFWAVALSVGIHFTLVFAALCLGEAVSLNWGEVSPREYFLLVPIINCVTSLPITISGLGLREGMYAQLFGIAGLHDATKAVAMSLLTYASLLAWSLFGAVVFMAYKHRTHHERLE